MRGRCEVSQQPANRCQVMYVGAGQWGCNGGCGHGHVLRCSYHCPVPQLPQALLNLFHHQQFCQGIPIQGAGYGSEREILMLEITFSSQVEVVLKVSFMDKRQTQSRNPEYYYKALQMDMSILRNNIIGSHEVWMSLIEFSKPKK